MNINQFNTLFPQVHNDFFYALDTMTNQYSVNNLVMFLSQISIESGHLKQLTENLNYSAKQLIKVWPSRFTVKNASLYAYQPEKLANIVYANRLGNGDENSGDGWKYRGRGLIQLTGKAIYTEFSSYINTNLDDCLDYIIQPLGAVESACWYWTQKHDLNKYITRMEVQTVTKLINGGETDLQMRLNEYDRILSVLTPE